jgi:peptide/nickel transport system substrate-binding protein
MTRCWRRSGRDALREKKWLRPVAAIPALMLVAAACVGGNDEGRDEAPGTQEVEAADIPTGGTLRIAGSSDVDFMDPAAMYYTLSFFLARGTLRQLVSYPPVADFEEQLEVVPDLATDTGHSNEDFTEWTFTLKDGVTFGKALGGVDIPGVTGEQIVCDDVKYGLERVFIPSVGGGYPYYYDIVEGWARFADGKADGVSGIECTDDRTIVFHLTEPAGDWPFRLTMPAASPVPRKYAGQFDSNEDSDYDNHVVSSGPYYIAEWSPGKRIVLERNENYPADTDEVRPAYVDSVDWKLGFDNDVGVQRVWDGDYHLGLDIAPVGPALEQTLQKPELKRRMIVQPSGCTRFIFMNTTIEPFDNQQVREAVNYAIDRSNLLRLRGGPVTGEIATSIIPPGLNGYLSPSEYNPFATMNMAGDIDRAKELMAEAGYADGFDGELNYVGASDPPHDRYAESVRADLQAMGFTNLKVKTPAFPNQYTQFYQVTDSETAIGTSAGWCKDYNDAFTYFDPVWNGENISTEGANLVYTEYNDPALNEAIKKAGMLTGRARDAAWQEVNRMATESGAWVPWTWENENIIFSDRLVNPIYQTFFSHVDLTNVGVAQE